MSILQHEPRRPASGEGPILARLSEVGYEVGSLADLRHSGIRYRDAIPILIGSLSQTQDTRTLEQVVRALSVPWAKPQATAPLIDLFHRIEDPNPLGLRWTVGNALDITWDDAHFNELVALARDRQYGRAREMIVLGMARSKHPGVGGVLVGLLSDPDVNGHAVTALRKLLRKVHIPTARPGLERMIGDKRAWVRKEAQRALAEMGET